MSECTFSQKVNVVHICRIELKEVYFYSLQIKSKIIIIGLKHYAKRIKIVALFLALTLESLPILGNLLSV